MEFNKASEHVNHETGFMFRYIYSETERLVEHTHDYYEIFLVTEGNLLHEVNGEVQHLFEGAFVLVRPDDVHKYSCDNKCRFLNLAFSVETMHKLAEFFGSAFDLDGINALPLPPKTVLSADQKDRMFRKFRQINMLEVDNTDLFVIHMRAFLAELISEYFCGDFSGTHSGVPEWLESLCTEMNSKENFMKGSSRMIELSGRSREHLSRSVKKYLGVTISEYINGLRLNYAANMLLNSNMSILDICFDCGFENVSWFYKKFAEKFGASPKVYRKKNGENL